MLRENCSCGIEAFRSFAPEPGTDRLPELLLSSFKCQLKTHMALPALVYVLVALLCLVHNVVRRCCDL